MIPLAQSTDHIKHNIVDNRPDRFYRFCDIHYYRNIYNNHNSFDALLIKYFGGFRD